MLESNWSNFSIRPEKLICGQLVRVCFESMGQTGNLSYANESILDLKSIDDLIYTGCFYGFGYWTKKIL